MAEPRVYTASLEAVDSQGTDPDRPISGRLLKDSRKPDRAGLVMVLYLADDSRQGDIGEPDRVLLNPPKGRKRKARGPPNRKVADLRELQDRLKVWVDAANASDPLRAVRPRTFILHDKGIKALATVHPARVQSIDQVVATLQETPEWEEEWGQRSLP
ncbi:hypothetical protein B0H14DRAFT_2581818 [Mycena olivaceomarginata]|nr:hypothetical protein B0H14DRAFT_2581818 [Mycena olivaceomarginata]